MWYLKNIDIVSKVSDAAGFSPTPIPSLPPVARIDNYLVDKNAEVPGIWSGQDVPVIEADSDVLYQSALLKGSGIEQLLLFIATLQDLDIAVGHASIYNEEYSEVTLSDGVVVLYSSRQEPVATAYKLQKMYAILSIEGELPEKIDLRFNKPAIIH